MTLPDLMQDLNLFTFLNGAGNPPIMWEYRPQVVKLKTGTPYPHFRMSTSRTHISYGTKVDFNTKVQVTVNEDATGMKFEKADQLDKDLMNNIPYTTSIEQAGSIMHGFNEYAGGLQPPSLHVGVLPVHAYSTDPNQTKVQEIIGIYKVETLIEIEYSFDFTHTNQYNVHPIMKTFGTFDVVDANSTNYMGEYAYGYRSQVPTVQVTKTTISTTPRPGGSKHGR